jgi:hypothetical protein
MRHLFPCGFLLIIAANGLAGQAPRAADPKEVLRQVDDALKAGELVKAADLATQLDEEVQRRFRASLVTDAAQRVDETLEWLPSDMESLFVLQRPVVVNSGELEVSFSGRPAEYYALDRIAALDQGRIIRQLDGRTIRLTIAAVKNMRTRGIGMQVPALMPDGDAAYFYYFTAPIEPALLGSPDEKAGAFALWMRAAEIDTGEQGVPGSHERPKREDRTWLALARPDLLVAASSKELMVALLGRMGAGARPEQGRALPRLLPEWSLVDRSAPFWGLRHFSELGSRRDLTNPRWTDDGAAPDPLSRGLAVRFDVDSGTVETRFVHAGGQPPSVLARSGPGVDFQADKSEDGTWRLRSNIRERGPFPFHLALCLLGFGGYR